MMETKSTCTFSSHKTWNVLQGLPLRDDTIYEELLLAYNCCVTCLCESVHPGILPLSVLPDLEKTFLRLCEHLDIEVALPEVTIIHRIQSMVLLLVKDDHNVSMPLALLSIFVAVCLLTDDQLTEAHNLFIALSERSINTHVPQSTDLKATHDNTTYNLVGTSSGHSENQSVIPVSNLVNILTSCISLCRRDYQGCVRHIQKIENFNSLGESLPSLIYLNGFAELQQGDIVATRKTLETWRHSNISHVSPKLWNLCGCVFAKQDRPNTAIQMFKESLKLDFDYVLPMYNIALQYRSLGLADAELETLNILVTTLEQQKTKSDKSKLCTVLGLEILGPGIRITDVHDHSTLSLESALYTLCRRCMDLERYDVAAQRYLDLLSLLSDPSRPSVNSVTSCGTTLPSTALIYVECAQCMIYSHQYKQCVTVCDRLIQQWPLTETNLDPSVEHSVSDPEGCGVSKKRVHSGSDKIDVCTPSVPANIQACMYRADAFVHMMRHQDAIDSLNSIIDILENNKSNVEPHRDSGEGVQPATKRARLDSGGSSKPVPQPTVLSLRGILASAYSKKSIIQLGQHDHEGALSTSRLAVTASKGDVMYLYNHTLLLHKLSRHREACTTWLHHRGESAQKLTMMRKSSDLIWKNVIY